MNSSDETHHQTYGVKTLLGDPKKAIVKLSLPMIVAMSIQTIYNLADAVWVAGRGPEALSAIGFFFPFVMLMISLSTGVGIGGGAIVSQRIGARDVKGADAAATHTMLLMLIVSFVIMFLCLIFAEPIFRIMGATRSLDRTLAYARIMFSATVIMFFAQVGNALLRSEGDAKRVMFAMTLGGVLNIILDPFFIYRFDFVLSSGRVFQIGLGLDVAGAAYATVVSMAVSCVPVFYWLFIKKNTYVTISFKKFRYRPDVVRSIIRIGVPTALLQFSMSLMMFFINMIITRIGGDDNVAVFNTGWRTVQVATLPILGIASAVTAVGGAAYGAKDLGKLSSSYYYALRIGVAIELVLSALTFIFAPWITRIFTWSAETARLVDDITLLLRYMCLFYPATAVGMVSSGFFQGMGKGTHSLVVTVLRTLLIAVPASALLGLVMNMGMRGVYIGILMGSWSSSFVAYFWAVALLRKTGKEFAG